MVVTAEEVTIIDKNSEELGVSVLQLMENAGAGAARLILEHYSDAKNIVICCGIGNNGGDGFVVARHLSAQVENVSIYLIGQESRIRSAAAKKNYQILKEQHQSINLVQIKDSSEIAKLKKQLKSADLVVDALLGTGITKTPYEPIKSAIKAINNAGKPIASIDLPSGMNSDQAKKTKIMINADLVTTFHDTKPCLTIDELKSKTKIVNIGVPKEAITHVGKGDFIVTYPKRKAVSHKGQNGVVLVIGGSKDYSGAPILSSQAALRAGADLVYTCVPQIIADVSKNTSPNLIIRSFDKTHLTPKSLNQIVNLVKNVDSIVIGPGIGTHSETFKFINDFLKIDFKPKSIIIDADALKAIKDSIDILKNNKTILTPHAGEYKLLFGTKVEVDLLKRTKQILSKSKEISSTIVLKGKNDVISDGNSVKINRTGHPGMTVGGTGDVLAGVIGAICSIVPNTYRSSCASTYLTGKAGEYAAKEFGNSLLATDVIEMIPKVILDLK
ncbi:MAG: NAD(P)H-hydrate dehydratase [Asgard group archaeon]|nr:NAD(P)H-hydrate dehydratase [Asgard group archaeon]